MYQKQPKGTVKLHTLSLIIVGSRRAQHDLVYSCHRCLEVGCGSGYVICSVAKMLSQHGLRAHVLASDISSAALQATQETLVAHGVSAHTTNMVTESRIEVEEAHRHTWWTVQRARHHSTVQVADVELVQGDLLKPFIPRFQHQVDLLVCLWSIQPDAVPQSCTFYRGANVFIMSSNLPTQLRWPYHVATAVYVRLHVRILETCLGDAGTKPLMLVAHV